MKKALGMIEFKTVASGITATDIMLKTADVEVISAGPVCPGKYLATISGELSAVKASIEAAERYNSAMLVDKFLLGNPHESVQPAICGALEVKNKGAIGILETFTAASAVVAADTAAKRNGAKDNKTLTKRKDYRTYGFGKSRNAYCRKRNAAEVRQFPKGR